MLLKIYFSVIQSVFWLVSQAKITYYNEHATHSLPVKLPF